MKEIKEEEEEKDKEKDEEEEEEKAKEKEMEGSIENSSFQEGNKYKKIYKL